MTRQSRVVAQRLRAIESFREFDFRIALVDGIVTVTADIDAAAKLLTGEAPPERVAAVQLARNEVVEGQSQVATA